MKYEAGLFFVPLKVKVSIFKERYLQHLKDQTEVLDKQANLS